MLQKNKVKQPFLQFLLDMRLCARMCGMYSIYCLCVYVIAGAAAA